MNDIRLPLDRLDPARLPVLLLGGINLARTLGLAGIPAVVASPDPDDAVFASRHCAGRCVIPPLAHRDAVDALVAIGDRLCAHYGRRVPLMYGSDDALELVYAHRERLDRHFRVLACDTTTGIALLEKDRFQALAAARGLPVPRDLRWDGEGPGSVAGMKGPVLAKPRVKVDWYASQMRERLFDGAAKARVFPTGAIARADPALALFHPQLAFQPWIPGGDECLWSFHGVADEAGRVIASFVGRKIRTCPPRTGESAFIEIAYDEALDRLGREVAARVPLQGVFKMDFKRDPRDGRWYLLEINARYNLWLHLGARNGVNLMRAAYDYMLEGRRPPPVLAARRYRWLALDLDWRAFRALAARKELTATRWLWSVLASRNVYNVFAWDDPGPWLASWRDRIVRRLARAPRRLLAALRP